MWVLLWFIGAVLPLFGQQGCASTHVWAACDLAFNLQPQEISAQPELRAEFRSPHHRTLLIHSFRDSDRTLVLRFAPTESGTWEYRVTSSIQRFDGQMGQLNAIEPNSPAFIRVANIHHFATEEQKPHLWMSTSVERFLSLPRAEFDQIVDQRAREHFTHLRITFESGADLQEAANRIRAINAKGLIADVTLGTVPENAQERERYVADVVARFAAFNVTWAGVPAFENVAHGRAVVKDIGTLLRKLDPYEHPRTTGTLSTSGPLAGDGWMNLLTYSTAEPNVGGVEHQLYQFSSINTGIKSQQDLWNATMNGQYPASGSGAYMKAWFEFMSGNRYWELEPYFDIEGGRAVALEGTEYIVYVEKPGPIEINIENHNYDVVWMNPATGEITKAKDFKGEHYMVEPPDSSHEWVLRVSREGRKASMLRSYKFDSRAVDGRPSPVQEIEQNPAKIPFEIAAPQSEEISLSHLPMYSLKIKRDSKATRSLLVEWTADVIADEEGYRVAGTGREGTLQIPSSVAHKLPGVLTLRAAILNAYGKAYTLDKVYRLVP